MAAYSSSNWLNFVSTSVEDEIRGREDYDFSDIEEIRRYQLQFYPIFAITGPIRILITYGIWQYMRNYLVRTDQFTDLSPYGAPTQRILSKKAKCLVNYWLTILLLS